ncbi:ribosome-binding factor A [bacterium BMS3Abin05]|nr:ribosome-binding factor A [bacterium BMS3Abin05]GBE28149.1 ribosome-binding factor A [bacterium BMS3Bbin03]HDK35443.1 30S ribosome-binding factor RbfA [Bacteroidota bacterium]
MAVPRSLKVGDLLKHEISNIMLREIKDPRVKFSTITAVKVSNDLKNAWVYISVMAEEEEKASELQALNHAESFVRNLLKTRVTLKYIPHLEFRLDETLDYAEKIERLIDQIKKEDV